MGFRSERRERATTAHPFRSLSDWREIVCLSKSALVVATDMQDDLEIEIKLSRMVEFDPSLHKPCSRAGTSVLTTLEQQLDHLTRVSVVLTIQIISRVPEWKASL